MTLNKTQIRFNGEKNWSVSYPLVGYIIPSPCMGPYKTLCIIHCVHILISAPGPDHETVFV